MPASTQGPSKTLTGGWPGGRTHTETRGRRQDRTHTRTHALGHTNTLYKTHTDTHTHTHVHKHTICRVWTLRSDSEMICSTVSPARSKAYAGKFSHTAKHKGPMSGKADSTLKPKPIRSLMQTCRGPFVVYFPF